MNKRKGSANSDFIRNSYIIFVSEWAIYIICLLIMKYVSPFNPRLISVDYIRSYLSFNFLIFLPTLILWSIFHYFRIQNLKGKRYQYISKSKIHLIWLIFAFIMLYIVGRSLFITVQLLGFDPCSVSWSYCIRRNYIR